VMDVDVHVPAAVSSVRGGWQCQCHCGRAECRVERVQSAERRAQSAECLEGTVCRAIKVGARILEEAQAGAQPETVFVSRAGTG
jgi:hypothetical protein